MMSRSMSPGSQRVLSPARQLLLWILLFSAYRLWVLVTSPYTLFADESYYFGWAQQLDWGFYSKPPMVAWLIAATTGLCGDSESCIKIGAWLLYPLTTWVIYLLGRELFDARSGFWSALAFLTLPVVFVSSQIISTDVLLILFWSLALLFFVRAVRDDSLVQWLLVGLAGGLGLLSKYTMGIFALSVLLYLLTSPEHRRLLLRPGPWLAAAVALLVFAPNIAWNLRHDFATIVHTAEISQLDQDLFHPDSLFEFLAGQLLVFGLLFTVMFLLFTASVRRQLGDARYRLLWWFAVPFIVVISLQALLARAHLNWAAPAYVAATVLVCAWLLGRGWRRLLLVALILNVVQGVALYHFDSVMRLAGVQVTAAIDPYRRVRGWDQVGEGLQPVYEQYRHLPLLGDERKSLAQIVYYLRPHPFDAVMWNPLRARRSQYDLTTDMEDHIGGDFFYITYDDDISIVASRFETVTPLKSVRVQIHPDYVLSYNAWHLQGFRGY